MQIFIIIFFQLNCYFFIAAIKSLMCNHLFLDMNFFLPSLSQNINVRRRALVFVNGKCWFKLLETIFMVCGYSLERGWENNERDTVQQQYEVSKHSSMATIILLNLPLLSSLYNQNESTIFLLLSPQTKALIASATVETEK